jgi:hypothetical protein
LHRGGRPGPDCRGGRETCQILIRAHPFEHMPFHGKCRQDFVTWRTTYSGIQPDQFDLDNPDHEEKLGYGRAINFSRANCRCKNVYLWKPNTWCSWRKCGGTLHPSPTTWPTNTSAIASTVTTREPRPTSYATQPCVLRSGH